MPLTNPRKPAFSKVLYVVPLNSENSAAVNDGVLSGNTAISSSSTAAQGVSLTSRHFIPVNAPGTDNDASGIDYGTDAQNLAAQREQCEQVIGDRGEDGSLAEIGYTVYGNS